MPALLFRNKYALFQEHHERLLHRPDPAAAPQAFALALARARRVQAARLGLYAVVYFSAVAAVASFVLGSIEALADLRRLVQTLATVTSAVTVLALLGILACGRFLSFIDLELYYASQECRIVAGQPIRPAPRRRR